MEAYVTTLKAFGFLDVALYFSTFLHIFRLQGMNTKQEVELKSNTIINNIQYSPKVKIYFAIQK